MIVKYVPSRRTICFLYTKHVRSIAFKFDYIKFQMLILQLLARKAHRCMIRPQILTNFEKL